MSPSERPTPWAIFFPFDGIILQDSPDILTTPLFGDATLVAFETLVREFPEDLQPEDKVDAYIAVRRRAYIDTNIPLDTRKNELFIAEARNRARQVAALLSIAFLATSTEGYLTGLQDQFQHTRANLAVLDLSPDRGGFLSSSSGPTLDTFTYNDWSDIRSFSQLELQTFLEHPLLQNLVSVFKRSKTSLAPALQSSIIQSCVRLAHAFHETSYTAQLLGAIISIEILLSSNDQSTRFDIKARRLGVLVGHQILQKYDFEQLLQARHMYVHQGKDITTRDYPLRALGIALYALLIYAILTKSITQKETLLNYLDAIYFNDQLRSSGLDVAKEFTSIGLEQIRQANPLPFLTYVNDVTAFDKEYDAGFYD